MKELFILAGGLMAAIGICVFTLTISNEERSDLLALNAEALAGGEFWENFIWVKEWQSCTIEKTITVTSGCLGVSIGTIPYTATIEATLQSCGGSYSIEGGGPGQKSYCKDGNVILTCVPDNCR